MNYPFQFRIFFIVAVVALGTWSCGSDDDGPANLKPRSLRDLPGQEIFAGFDQLAQSPDGQGWLIYDVPGIDMQLLEDPESLRRYVRVEPAATGPDAEPVNFYAINRIAGVEPGGVYLVGAQVRADKTDWWTWIEVRFRDKDGKDVFTTTRAIQSYGVDQWGMNYFRIQAPPEASSLRVFIPRMAKYEDNWIEVLPFLRRMR